MTKEELFAQALSSYIDVAEGDYDGQKGFWLHWNNPANPNDGQCSFLPESQLATAEWEPVKRFVLGGRDVEHVTRVVGYYSRKSNWNKSKIGEGKDRQKGNYAVS
jgi:hypothetical protein